MKRLIKEEIGEGGEARDVPTFVNDLRGHAAKYEREAQRLGQVIRETEEDIEDALSAARECRRWVEHLEQQRQAVAVG